MGSPLTNFVLYLNTGTASQEKKNAARIESYGERKSKHEQGRVRRWKGAGRGRGSIYENE